MKHQEFFNSIKNINLAEPLENAQTHSSMNNQLSKCYLFEGEEEHVKSAALERLKEKILLDEFYDFNFAVLKNPSFDVMIAAAQTLPMMAPKRLVVLKDLQWLESLKKDNRSGAPGKYTLNKETLNTIENFLINIPQETCVVLYAKGGLEDKKALSKILKKQTTWVSFNTLTERELITWIRQTFKKQSKDISFDLAKELIFISGRDCTNLNKEIEKITAYMGTENTVTMENIKSITIPTLEYTVFDLVDALVVRNRAKTFILTTRILEQGESIIKILALFLRQYRIMLFAKTMMDEGVKRANICRLLGIYDFVLTKAIKQGNKYTLKQLKQAVEIWVEADYNIKSGVLTDKIALDSAIDAVFQL